MVYEVQKVNNINFNGYKQPAVNKKVEKPAVTAYPQMKNYNPLYYKPLFGQVSFSGNREFKKGDLTGFDYTAAQKFKPDFQKIKSKEQFNTWAKNEVDKASNLKQYEAKFGELKERGIIVPEEGINIVNNDRMPAVKEWVDYLTKENDLYIENPAIALIVLSGILKGVKGDTQTAPPVLNKGVLADTVDEIQTALENDKTRNFDFKKTYENNLRLNTIGEDSETGETATKWVKIPSKENDPENFEENVKKLKTLSHNSWCTKSANAKPYLAKGDFWVYLEEGKPKLGVRFNKDTIQEIQGPKNDFRIPIAYLKTVEDLIDENNFKINNYAKAEIKQARKSKIEIEEFEKEFEKNLSKDNPVDVFEYFGFEVKEDENGGLILNKLGQPSVDYTFKDLGVNEKKLLENVVRVKGNCTGDFNVKSMPRLEYIGGIAYFAKSKIEELPRLESIEGDAHFEGSQIKELPRLEYIGGHAYFHSTQIKELPRLEYIGKHAASHGSKIEELSKYEIIEGSAYFNNSKIKGLPRLESIEGEAYFEGSQIKELPRLEYIGHNANFTGTQIKELPMLTTILGTITVDNKQFNCGDKIEQLKQWLLENR